jgi:hypothetical protein
MRGHLLAIAPIPRACFWRFQDTLLRGRFRFVPKLRAVHSFVLPKSATGRDSPSRGCFPTGNARAPTRRVSNTPSSPLRACVALEKPVAFRKGRRSIRQRRSAKNYRLETRHRCRRRIERGPRCFRSCRFAPNTTIARRTRRDRPPLLPNPCGRMAGEPTPLNYPSRLMPIPSRP